MKITRTESFDLAYRFVTETNSNIYLTGKAGTGKTTFLKFLKAECLKKIVVAAPTGVAAINAGGVTLHSLFQLPFGPILPAPQHGNGFRISPQLAQIFFTKPKLNLLRTMELLVIDECSMVASYTVDAIDSILRKVRHNYHLPFGGVQVLFIGDLHQLPPVVKAQEWELLRGTYNSVFFFDSLVLRNRIPAMIELKEIFRQRDASFIDILNQVRHNEISSQALASLNSRLIPDFEPDKKDGYIYLTSHNFQADEINSKNLNQLSETAFLFRAETEGTFSENAFPAEELLTLKTGAQVMFLRNDSEGKKYFNGKIGTVSFLSASQIKVRCPGESEDIEVRRFEWNNTSYSLNPETKEIEEKQLGSFVQYPLRLAWAITIHKSQGLTFEKLIIDSERAFATGQVYVALSRCTSLEGLVLTSPINTRFLGADQNLEAWNRHNLTIDVSQLFNESRQAFVYHVLKTIFQFDGWQRDIAVLRSEILRELEEEQPEAKIWFEKIIAQSIDLIAKADTFGNYLQQCERNHVDPDKDGELKSQILKATKWFADELTQWRSVFFNIPFSVSSKPSARKVDELLLEMNEASHEKLHRILCCSDGFALTSYLTKVRQSYTPPVKLKSAVADKKPNKPTLPSHSNSEIYSRLVSLRTKLSRERLVKPFQIFSNNTLLSLVEKLPGNETALLQIPGIKEGKLRSIGKEILDTIHDYCGDTDEPLWLADTHVKSKKKSTVGASKKSDTVETSLSLFKSGKTTEEIAKERGYAVSTIESHLSKALQLGFVKIGELMSQPDFESIAANLPEGFSSMTLTQIREKIPGEISWGKLKLVLAEKNKSVQ